MASLLGMKKPVLVVRPHRHHPKFKFILDLRTCGKGRLFFKTRAEADAECLRQKTLLERHSRAAIGLSQREMSDVITARERLAGYDKNINDAVEFFVDHLERVRRCKTTIAELVDEVMEAKRKDGKAPRYIESLRLYLSKFSRDFGSRSVAAITPEELDKRHATITWLRFSPSLGKCASRQTEGQTITEALDFKYDGPGSGKGGTGVLTVDGKEVANKKIPHTTPFEISLEETFDVGVDTRTGVDDKDYQAPFRFTGKLDKLTIKLEPTQLTDADRQKASEIIARAHDDR